jgi:hypothetical protein
VGDGTPTDSRTIVFGEVFVADVPVEQLPALVDILLREFFGSSLLGLLPQKSAVEGQQRLQ